MGVVLGGGLGIFEGLLFGGVGVIVVKVLRSLLVVRLEILEVDEERRFIGFLFLGLFFWFDILFFSREGFFLIEVDFFVFFNILV